VLPNLLFFFFQNGPNSRWTGLASWPTHSTLTLPVPQKVREVHPVENQPTLPKNSNDFEWQQVALQMALRGLLASSKNSTVLMCERGRALKDRTLFVTGH